MRIFMAPGKLDTVETIRTMVTLLRTLYPKPKIYIVGEIESWYMVMDLQLDGLIKTPPELQEIIKSDKRSL